MNSIPVQVGIKSIPVQVEIKSIPLLIIVLQNPKVKPERFEKLKNQFP
jgi:hypothetical protein